MVLHQVFQNRKDVQRMYLETQIGPKDLSSKDPRGGGNVLW